MKIVYGDILAITKGIIVQQVNCKGVMGAGLALQIRNKWPSVYENYLISLADGSLKLGGVKFILVDQKLYVANMASQDNYGYGKTHTSLVAMLNAFPTIAAFAKGNKLQIYFPWKIGCGLGGGRWNGIEPAIDIFFPEAIAMKLDKQ